MSNGLKITLVKVLQAIRSFVKVPLQANFFIGDIKSRHDFYSICPKIFRFGQFVRILWPFKVGKRALFD